MASSIANQFTGLPIENLIAAPLLAAAEGQKSFRGVVAKLNHLGFQSRPDLCFEAKAFSTLFGKATKKDLKAAVKKAKLAKTQTTKMFFSNIGPMEEWILVGLGDAGVKTLPDKIGSVGGQVVLLGNKITGKVCVLSWRSKKLIRKVVSSLAGEALATNDTLGEIVYSKAVLKQLFGEDVDNIPVVILTDSNNLFKSVYSTSLVDDARLIPDIAVLKEAIETGEVDEIRKVEQLIDLLIYHLSFKP